MCVIIIKQKGQQVSDKILRKSAEKNPHGLGIVWLDTYKIEKTESKNWKLLAKINRPYIAHFRFATQGAKTKENIHPFVVPYTNDTEWLMQNGTIYDYAGRTECDTKCMAHDLGIVRRPFWDYVLSEHDCRFVTINTKTKSFRMYNKDDWFKHDGVWFSKANVLDGVTHSSRPHTIAVYGTLKHSFSNWNRYLRNADYVDIGVTKEKYPLIIHGLPYLVDKVNVGHKVDVDVFNVNDAELKAIDQLEGHPTWYKRRQIDVETMSHGTIKCWVYFNPQTLTGTEKYHESYNQKIDSYKQNTLELWQS